ncbi:MAG: right-handed parallel beta-helix repeat-containing protein, partial [Tannerella sp.]|nr:right-handed parallel beta-helix repeat-containing protein [Tannerella sp.]
MMKSTCFILLGAFVLFASCSDGVRLYVSPDGDDCNTGTASSPLQTLEGARNAVRAAREIYPEKKVTVYFKGGVYTLERAVGLTADDSGSERAPVVYRAMDGETPVFTGGKTLARWTKRDNAQLKDRLLPQARDKMYVCDLTAEGITGYGDPTDAGKHPELICNGQIQTLARWPNTGFVTAGIAKGATTLPATYIKVHGTKEGVFEYLDAYQDRWAQEEDVRLGGYWYWDWKDEFQKVAVWDAYKHIVRTAEPYHMYGYRDSLRYFGLNLLCEIDQPGEWYLSRTTGKLYWYPPEGVDPNEAEVSLTCFEEPFMIETVDCSHVTFEGLTFREGRGSAIGITGGTNILLSGCRIERFGQDGVHITGGAHHGASGCYMSMFGHGGFKITGGDRKTLTPCNHFVEHTVVENFSLFQRTYEPAIYLEGCGARIANNRFSHSSSSAMRLEGNDFIIEYNEIDHVVNESDDQGGIDMWYNPSYRGVVIRYNRWSDIAGGTRHGAA